MLEHSYIMLQQPQAMDFIRAQAQVAKVRGENDGRDGAWNRWRDAQRLAQGLTEGIDGITSDLGEFLGGLLGKQLNRPGKRLHNYGKSPFIVDFPMKNGDFP